MYRPAQQLHPVSERVVDVQLPVAADGPHAGVLEASGQGVETAQEKGGVGLASGAEVRVDAEMDSDSPCSNPARDRAHAGMLALKVAAMLPISEVRLPARPHGRW